MNIFDKKDGICKGDIGLLLDIYESKRVMGYCQESDSSSTVFERGDI